MTTAGTDARHSLGIVRNLDDLHEAEAITEALIRSRLAARDVLLQPLRRERDEILASDPDAALRAFVDRALLADRTIDRDFWHGTAAELIRSSTDADQRALFREAARRIHATFAVPIRDRQHAQRRLARLIWTLS